MKSTIGIDVAAPAELLFRLARDVERWPQLLPHYIAATRQTPPDGEGRRVVRFIARRQLVPVLGLGVPVAWQSLCWAEDATCRLRFVHRGGATNGMDVTWRIEPRSEGARHSRVEIDHDFRPRVPGWAALIDRLFTRPIAGRTLATFRDIAEAVATSDESGRGPATNPSP